MLLSMKFPSTQIHTAENGLIALEIIKKRNDKSQPIEQSIKLIYMVIEQLYIFIGTHILFTLYHC
jgi:hypothetical protein